MGVWEGVLPFLIVIWGSGEKSSLGCRQGAAADAYVRKRHRLYVKGV